MDDPYAADAPFYDLVHSGAPQDDVGLWLSFAGQTHRPVLEAGTGTGRIALALAEAGHSVTAVDPSNAMLEIARSRAAGAHLDVSFLLGRVADVDLPPARFGFALVPADVFLYCGNTSGQIETLRALAAALEFNGVLAIDLPGPAMWLDPSLNGQPLLAMAGTGPGGDPLEVWHIREDDLAAQERSLTVRYESVDASGVVRRQTSTHTLRYVYRFEAECLLLLAGLALEAMYGDYDLEPLTTESERMIVVARRAGL